MAWSPAERGQAMGVGLPCSHSHLGGTALWSRVRAELGLGSFSSRGALIGFAVALVTVALVTLSGEQVASAALVTCVSPAPRGTKGSVGPSFTRLGLCRSPGR